MEKRLTPIQELIEKYSKEYKRGEADYRNTVRISDLLNELNTKLKAEKKIISESYDKCGTDFDFGFGIFQTGNDYYNEKFQNK